MSRTASHVSELPTDPDSDTQSHPLMIWNL